MIKPLDGVVFVGSGDSPDDRDVKWLKGHLHKAEFAAAAGCETKDVKHVFTKFECNYHNGIEDFAWWAEKATDDLIEPITMTFEFAREAAT